MKPGPLTSYVAINAVQIASLNLASWNQIATWLRQLNNLRVAA
jgi:hypothetical protein